MKLRTIKRRTVAAIGGTAVVELRFACAMADEARVRAFLAARAVGILRKALRVRVHERG